MPAQIRPNFRLLCVCGLAALLALVFYSLRNGRLFWAVVPAAERGTAVSATKVLPDLLCDDGWDDILEMVTTSTSFYAVVFDAGSTGTRVHIFHFKEDDNGSPGRPPLLVSETFNNTGRGLGEFADSPWEAMEVVQNLLKVALRTIPSEYHSSTPVALKATAGLRLIPSHKAHALLDAVYEMLAESPLQVHSRNQTVAIIDGIHEGEFIWLTVNFLNGFLGTQDHSNSTVGVLDLGGGSTQITFSPRYRETIEEGLPLGLIKSFKFMKTPYQLYTHSYLGLGLKEARIGILKMEQQKRMTSTANTATNQNDNDPKNRFTTVCLPAKAREASWEFAGAEYVTWSANSQEVTDTYALCSAVTQAFLSGKVYRTREVQNHSFYASSYFLGKSVECGLIRRETGGIVEVKDLVRAAQKACGSFDSSNPFLCMDLVFISTLLTHGYGFHGETQLLMHERIHGFQTSWALGATLDLLHSHWERNLQRGNL